LFAVLGGGAGDLRSPQSVIELQTKAAEEVARALKGEPPRSPVNREVLGW
jgi:hypothetical protein